MYGKIGENDGSNGWNVGQILGKIPFSTLPSMVHGVLPRNFFEQEEVRAMFQSLDLSARDSWTLFKLLDEAGNGDINLSVSGAEGMGS